MRISWIDNAKAIGIILVLYAHTNGIPTPWKHFIFTFHMPLFFFLSGCLVKEKHLDGNLKAYTGKQARSLLVPYVSFFFLSYLYWLPTHKMGTKTFMYVEPKFYEPFLGLFYGVGEWLYVNWVLWFFPCLFVTAFVFFVLRLGMANNRAMALVLMFLPGLAVPFLRNSESFRLPWSIDLSLVGLTFYATGYLLTVKRDGGKLVPNSLAMKIFLCAVFAVVTGIVAHYNGKVSIDAMNFRDPRFYFLGAFAGIFMVFYLSHCLPENYVGKWLSMNTIILFPLHMMMFSLFTAVGVVGLGLNHHFKNSLLFGILYVFFAVAASIPATYVVKRFFPFLVGWRPIVPDRSKD